MTDENQPASTTLPSSGSSSYSSPAKDPSEKVAAATIHAGICGFVTTARATCREKRKVTIDFETNCPHIEEMGKHFPELDAYQEISWRGGSTVYDLMAKYARHACCPVGSGIIKALEVSAGLALPQEVSISVKREPTT